MSLGFLIFWSFCVCFVLDKMCNSHRKLVQMQEMRSEIESDKGVVKRKCHLFVCRLQRGPYGLMNIIYSKMNKLLPYTISWTFQAFRFTLSLSRMPLPEYYEYIWMLRNYAANTHGQNAIVHNTHQLYVIWWLVKRKCLYTYINETFIVWLFLFWIEISQNFPTWR